MDPSQPAQNARAAEKAEAEASAHYDEVNKISAEIDRLRGQIDTIRLNEGKDEEATRNEADRHPDQADYWRHAADQKHEKTEQQIATIDQRILDLKSHRDKEQQKADVKIKEAEDQKSRAKQNATILAAQQATENNDQQAA